MLDGFFGNSNTVTVSQVVWRPSYDKRMSSFGSLAPFLYPCLQPELDQLAQALLAWSLVLVDDFPCSLRSWRDCSVLFWAAEPTLETRQASGDGRGDADYSQSSRGFVVKKTTALAR